MVWDAVVKAALVGTQRQRSPLPDAPELDALLDRTHPEIALLQAIAIVSLQRQAGRCFPQLDAPLPEAAPPETLPLCSAAATQLLGELLQQEDSQEAVAEWLQYARQCGVRVAPELLPDLLALGVRSRDLRAQMLPSLGYRGYWLAAQRSEWQFAALSVCEPQSAEQWQGQTHATRRFWLQQIRERDAERARDWLSQSWKALKAGDRAEYLKTFICGLSAADEPFLEAALDDKSQQVRGAAADLLTQLPDSGLIQRVTQWVRPRLQLQHRHNALRLQVTLPKRCTAELERDGVKAKKPAKTRAETWWFLQQLARVPPSVWSDIATPQEWLTAAEKHAERDVLLEGWAVAAMRHGDCDWGRSLVEVASSIPGILVSAEERDRALLLQLPEGDREGFVLQHLENHPQPFSKRHPSLAVLRSCVWPWRDEFARAILERFAREIAASEDRYDWGVRSTFRDLARRIDPDLEADIAPRLAEVTPPGSYWEQTIGDFFAILSWRRALIRAFFPSHRYAESRCRQS